MTQEQLKKANELASKILGHEQALNCFEYDANIYDRIDIPNLPVNMVSTNPRLIIEHDDIEEGDGRTTTLIPIVLNDFIIEMIKSAIYESKKNLQDEFDNL